MSAPRTLHLLRHGAPERTGLLLGRTDPTVTEAGIAACRAAASGVQVARVVSSDRQRALACAVAIDARASIDARWREMDFGEWDGLAPAAVDPAALARFWDDPDAWPPPGGERWSTLVERVSAAIAALADGPTLVVTHAGAMRAALAALLGWGWREASAVALPYAALLSIDLWLDGTAQLTGLRA